MAIHDTHLREALRRTRSLVRERLFHRRPSAHSGSADGDEPGAGAGLWQRPAFAKSRRPASARLAIMTADVFFLTGGTQTNTVVISALLAGHEGVIAADTGHIAVHEAGAIEATGHKGAHRARMRRRQLRAADVEAFIWRLLRRRQLHLHGVPGHGVHRASSELGTLYSLAELEELSTPCHRHQIPLYLDARLAYGLAAPDTDVTLTDIARPHRRLLASAAQMRALCGEAVVRSARRHAPPLPSPTPSSTVPCWPRGACWACSSDTLFTDRLYDELGRHAIAMAGELRHILREAGCTFPRKPHQPAVRRSGQRPVGRHWPSASASAPGKSSGTAAPSSASSPASPPPPTISQP